MFIPDSLCPGASEHHVMLNGRKAIRVALHTVQFTAKGMTLIGLGMLAISERYGLPLGLLRLRMAGHLYSVPPGRSLYFLFDVPEFEAQMHVEVPLEHWRFAVPEQAWGRFAVPA